MITRLPAVRLSPAAFSGRSSLERWRGGVAFLGFGLFCWSLVASGFAQAQTQIETGYYERLRTTDDALPHNSVRGVVQDRRGFIWLGTVGGLARFDGRDIQEIKIPEVFRKTGYSIRSIGQETEDTLLIATTSGELVRLRGSQFSAHPISAQLKGLYVGEFVIEPGGVLWIVDATHRLIRWEKGKLEEFDQSRGVEGVGHLTVARDGEGNTWIGGDDFLGIYRNGTLTPLKDNPPGLKMLATSRSGQVWVCTAQGLERLEKGRLVRVLADAPWAAAATQLRHAFEDTQGVLWIASSRTGLYRYFDGKLIHLETSFSAASFIMEDTEGDLWVATDGNGIAQLRAKTHRLFNTRSGLPQQVCSGLSEDAAGAIWVANRAGGLVKIVDYIPQPASSGSALARTFANTVCADRNGYLWFGGGSGGLWRAPFSNLEAIEKMPVPTGNFNLLYCAKNGDIWFAKNAVLGYYREGQEHLVPLETLAQLGRFQSAAEDRAGTIWFGTTEGYLAKYDGARLEVVEDGGRLPRQSIHSVYVDDHDVLWMATADGLGVKEGDRISMIGESQGLADRLIIQLVEDDRGYLWLGSRRGLFYVSKEELLGVARGTRDHVLSHAFGKDQGLVGFSPVANYQPSTHKARDGTLWFAAANGALAIDARAQKENASPPPVYIDQVVVDNHPLAENAAVVIPPGDHTLEFRFAAPSFAAPESVELRHQLQGVDREWIQTSNARSATYSHLRPGHYQLKVVARNSYGVWNQEGALLRITVLPAWWQTLWADAAALVLFAVAVAAAARYWAHRKLKRKLDRLEREHALEKERTRIARDLHDDLGGGLIEIGLLADRLAINSPPEVRGPLHILASRTRRLGAELASIIWAVNAKNESLDRLALFVRTYSRRLFFNSAIECVVTGAETIPPLPLSPDTQHHLLAIAKEATNNVLKHSRATHVSVEMRQIGDIFELCVEDDGVGFPVDTAAVLEGNGLQNMRARATEIGGNLKIDSGPERGTIVVLTYRCGGPLAPKTTEAPTLRTDQ